MRLERGIGLIAAIASGLELGAGHWVLSALLAGVAWLLVDLEVTTTTEEN